jgi:hypothetical protein
LNRDQLRAAMPTVAAIVDEYREWMKDGGKVVYGSENGHVIDRRTPESEVYELELSRFRQVQPKAEDRAWKRH